MRRLQIVFLALMLAACAVLPQDARPPRVSVADVGIKSLGLFEQRFDIGLRVANPNDFDLTLEALDFDLEVNGHPFATGLSRVSTRVPATSTAVVRVEGFMQSRDLIEHLRRLAPGAFRDGVPYRIKGRVKIDRSSEWLPFDHEGVYGGERRAPQGRAV